MDSKDLVSSSSFSVAGNRDASSVEDDGVLSAAAALAKDAAVAFHSGKFAECVDVLDQLLQKKENDLKVLHNIAIARYFQDGGPNPKTLFEVLNNVKSSFCAVAVDIFLSLRSFGRNKLEGVYGKLVRSKTLFAVTPSEFRVRKPHINQLQT
ncbi:hypothetical protein U1Q18_028313 [Sarracenia purpurea var. burkii]